jgi:PAS domain S-box-containing protein
LIGKKFNRKFRNSFHFAYQIRSLRELDPHDETSPPVVFWSSGGRIHHANSTFCRLVGYSVDELRVVSESQNNKIRAHSLFHPEETVKILSRQLDAVQQPMLTSYQLKTRLLGKNKQEIPVSCSISNLRDPVGTPLLTMAHFSVDL